MTLDGLAALFGKNSRASAAYALRRPYATRRPMRAADWGVEVPLTDSRWGGGGSISNARRST